MDHFKLVSEYSPTGDQPQAIEQLVQGFKEGNQCDRKDGLGEIEEKRIRSFYLL